MDVSKMSLCAAIGVVLAGCAASPFGEDDWPPARRADESIPSNRAPRQPASMNENAQRAAIEPEGELSLRDAIAVALLADPGLAALSMTVRAAEARTLQAGLPSNPELGIELENFAGSGDASGTDALETTLLLSQTFPLGGDLARRRRVAALRGELASWDYESARISLMTEVARRFIDVVAAQRDVALAEESLDLSRQVFDAIRRRIDAGDAPDIERSRAVVPVATASIEMRRARRALEAARIRLALTWGTSTPRFTSAIGDFDEVRAVPPAMDLIALVNRNPEVARWAVEITARQAQVRLAQAQAVPDLTGALGVRRLNDSDDTALVAGISIPLPLFDRGQGDILAVRLDAAAAHQERRVAELRIEEALAAAHSRLQGAHDEVLALREEALPPAEEAWTAIRAAFDQGNLGLLDVLDAERTLIDLRRAHLRALAAYHGAVAEIEGLIAQPLAEVGSTSASQPPEE